MRYFLLRHVRPFEDSDFSEVRLAEAYEGELANGLGNLCSRLTALCERFGVEAARTEDEAGSPAPSSLLEAYRFDRALDLIWRDVSRINREIAVARPWDEVGGSPHARAQLELWSRELDATAHRLSPFLPETAGKIRRTLGSSPIRRVPPRFPRKGSGIKE